MSFQIVKDVEDGETPVSSLVNKAAHEVVRTKDMEEMRLLAIYWSTFASHRIVFSIHYAVVLLCASLNKK